MPIQLCVLLWEHPGRAQDLAAFEDEVLALLSQHGGRLISRHIVMERHDGDPLEVQLIEMPDEEALAEYLRDPVRVRLAHTHDRDAVIARTQLLRVEPRRQQSVP
ncbi:hypothetical protein [Geodermatophilus sp. DSM 44513]|uniref:hypothetical protein n=1 Tax=Geodermatophilus sp. DSM 44513 TaxID=1528104 RepID=UPI0014121AB1|nr:hypothetical protein [Geodermatophilus sp. DSM 44513]WNV74316.1 hypothetical protein RTG05_15130 [Geodermatophilus sp. DSM 44513]